MERFQTLNLNLAKNPVKNKRFFYLLICVLIPLILIVLGLNIIKFLEYFQKEKEVKQSILRIERKCNRLRQEEKRYLERIKNLKKENKEKVELINELIFKKSFSWTSLLFALENSMLGDTIIFSLRPELRQSEVKVRIEIGARNINGLLSFVNSLKKQNFQNIQVLNERKDEKGIIFSTISFNFPREIS
ncbi:MAG: hypothetical protein ACE5WD_09135 [Candidatus Aminicenantia bacterium]